MKWFKHQCNASLTIPVSQVMAAQGYYGVGVMWTIIERINLFDGSMRLKEIRGTFVDKHYTGKKLESLLRDFGIFRIDQELGLVYLNEFLSEQGPKQIPEQSPKQTAFNAHAFKENKIENKKRIDKDDEEEKEEGTAVVVVDVKTIKPDYILEAIENLETCDYWKEVTCMHNPAVADILQHHWAWFALYLRDHIVRLGKEEVVINQSETKNYIAKFCGNAQLVSRMLKAFREQQAAIEEKAAANDPYRYEDHNPDGKRSYNRGRKIPQDAPPRPSATAEWNTDWDRWDE